MNRTERLLFLMQILRQYRYPVSGEILAQKINVSIRTLYRDIALLKDQGAEIEGEPGLGYVLKPGFFLPPLMFLENELDALMLGIRWVESFGDSALSVSAKTALAKITEVLPKSIKDSTDSYSLRVGPPQKNTVQSEDLSLLRQAMRRERIIEFDYISSKERKNNHYVVWPFTIGYFPEKRILVAWNEKEKKFAYFQTGKIRNLMILSEKYYPRREILFKRWHSAEVLKL